MDLTKCVDVASLKRALMKEGCILPGDFPILLEKHLRVLVHRFTTKPNRWDHKTLKTVPNTQRSFFAQPRSEWGDWFISWDEVFVRGWKKELITPRDVVPLDRKQRRLTNHLKHIEEGLKQKGIRTPTKRFLDRIPRTKKIRLGTYAYVTASFDGKIITTGNRGSPARKHNGGSLPSKGGYEHLHLFGEQVEVLFIKGHLFLKDDMFFLFVR